MRVLVDSDGFLWLCVSLVLTAKRGPAENVSEVFAPLVLNQSERLSHFYSVIMCHNLYLHHKQLFGAICLIHSASDALTQKGSLCSVPELCTNRQSRVIPTC